MPEITIHAIEGRSIVQKRALVKDITDAVVKHFDVAACRRTRERCSPNWMGVAANMIVGKGADLILADQVSEWSRYGGPAGRSSAESRR